MHVLIFFSRQPHLNFFFGCHVNVEVRKKKKKKKEQMSLTCTYSGNFNVLKRQLIMVGVNCKFLKYYGGTL
jgi:hypothetical protein